MRPSLARLCLLVAAMVAAPFVHAEAQEWPARPVTLIVSQPAGAAPDVMARLIAERMGKIIGQPVVVENKPGAGNVVGTAAAARATPDGYTLFFATSAALVTNPYMMKNLPYNSMKDFVPVAFGARSFQILVVNPEVPAKNLAELIAIEKKSPGKVSMSVDGPRNLAGVVGAAINKYAGTTFVLIPATNPNDGARDVMTGRTEAGVFSVSVVEQLIAAGKLRAIAVAPKDRALKLPNVPSAAETIPGFNLQGWFMLVAPAGIPPAIVTKLNAAANTVLNDPEVKKLAENIGFEFFPGGGGTPAQAAEFLKSEYETWGKITKDLGIEPN